MTTYGELLNKLREIDPRVELTTTDTGNETEYYLAYFSIPHTPEDQLSHNEDLVEACQAIYERSGQYAVYDFVKKYYPDQSWGWCEPCDNETPTDEGDCLVCGSPAYVSLITHTPKEG